MSHPSHNQESETIESLVFHKISITFELPANNLSYARHILKASFPVILVLLLYVPGRGERDNAFTGRGRSFQKLPRAHTAAIRRFLSRRNNTIPLIARGRLLECRKLLARKAEGAREEPQVTRERWKRAPQPPGFYSLPRSIPSANAAPFRRGSFHAVEFMRNQPRINAPRSGGRDFFKRPRGLHLLLPEYAIPRPRANYG